MSIEGSLSFHHYDGPTTFSSEHLTFDCGSCVSELLVETNTARSFLKIIECVHWLSSSVQVLQFSQGKKFKSCLRLRWNFLYRIFKG